MCRDRRLFISFIWQKWFAGLALMLDAPELAQDPRFATNAVIQQNGEAMIAEVEMRLTTRDTAEWAELLAERGVPPSHVETMEDAARWPQVRECHLPERAKAEDRERDFEIVGSGIVFADHGPRVTGDVPRCGDATRSVPEAAGLSRVEIDRLVDSGVAEALDG